MPSSDTPHRRSKVVRLISWSHGVVRAERELGSVECLSVGTELIVVRSRFMLVSRGLGCEKDAQRTGLIVLRSRFMHLSRQWGRWTAPHGRQSTRRFGLRRTSAAGCFSIVGSCDVSSFPARTPKVRSVDESRMHGVPLCVNSQVRRIFPQRDHRDGQ